MSGFQERNPDDEREVPLDDAADFDTPPPTIDPLETVEDDVDDADAEKREAAIEAGQLDPRD
ncbi:hypothetical protein NQ152_14920 [Microbacterium sp. zg.B48]|uniref:hypothetical protein n=1 Tax=unclassified Microbacterium TaxID=2609290 RepID=UPI00214B9FB4|nr:MULTISPECIES: hypothetical protein [unclassified Microbacterium]MCR2764803.1 hypothetical protein [Microbacterium sp. zg.B48]MCR2810059.1 hypothetical protein [Microbacterium sp. zg.B185]WIM20101.1 hypothetical protein QNO12_04650 [Microbacterium sp. zg-B185]